jgi:hypothetical protein
MNRSRELVLSETFTKGSSRRTYNAVNRKSSNLSKEGIITYISGN